MDELRGPDGTNHALLTGLTYISKQKQEMLLDLSSNNPLIWSSAVDENMGQLS